MDLAKEKAIKEGADKLRWADEYYHSYVTIETWNGDKKEPGQIEYRASYSGNYSPSEETGHVLEYIYTFFPGLRKPRFGEWHLERSSNTLVRIKEGKPIGTLSWAPRELDEQLKALGIMKLCRHCMGGPELIGRDICQVCLDEEEKADREWEESQGKQP